MEMKSEPSSSTTVAPAPATNPNPNPDPDPDSLSIQQAPVRDDDAHSHTLSAFKPETQKDQQAGITRIETFTRLFPTTHPLAITLYLSILLVSISFSLDQSTTAAYDLYATNSFNRQSYLGIIDIVEGIVVAVSKPFIAKICDVFSRQTAYLLILGSYVIGYVVVATASDAVALCVGRVVSAAGQAGFDLVTDIVVADLSPLQWRGFLGSMTSFPYLFLPFVGSKIQASLCSQGTTGTCWRWGFGMFCIIAVALVTPIIVTLTYADRRAREVGEMSLTAARVEMERGGQGEEKKMTAGERMGVLKKLLDGIDIIGLVLLAFAFSLILLPFNLAAGAGGWDNPSMIAMIVCGFVILGIFILWEVFWAPFPVMNRRIWHNKTFICAVVLDTFYMISGNVKETYYSTWVYLIKDWNLQNWGNFVALTTVALTFFGLLAGLYQRGFHRYKALQIFGLSIRLVGLGIGYWAVGPNATTVALVWTQLLGAMGGACSVVGTRVATQASVPHQDLASIIAQLSLWTRLGTSVGSAIASHVYTTTYMKNLLGEGLTQKQALTFYGDSSTARTIYTWGSPEREAGIRAFTSTVRPLFLAALCLSFVPLFAGLFMPNYHLGKTQNKVDGTAVGGEVIELQETGLEEQVKEKTWYSRVWRGLNN